MNEGWNMIAVKREWIPEWLFEIFSWPVDLIRLRWLPFRYIFTKSIEKEKS